MTTSIRRIIWIIVAILILAIHFLMQFPPFSYEVQWNETIAYAVIFLAMGGAYELLRWLWTREKTYRIAFIIGFLSMFFLGWISGAVGIIGSENNPANLMYWAVPLVAVVGSLISRMKPRGMTYTMFATAIVHFLVPVFALFVWPANVSWGNAGVIGVFIINSIIAVLFAISGVLFRRAYVAD